jgi:alpha-tubulin suppressor-like RCC1 family protein
MYDETMKCWGDNSNGQLGDGTTTQRNAPTAVSAQFGFFSIATGYRHSCAQIWDGSLQCWGLNANGQLGDGTVTQRLKPTAVLSFP